MSDGVRKSFRKLLINNFKKLLKVRKIDSQDRELLLETVPEVVYYKNVDKYVDKWKNSVKQIGLTHKKCSKILEGIDDVISFAEAEVEDETLQAMEALVHNLNTMQSRAGAQVPFSSLNYGTDTSPEGRLVMSSLLDATDKGLGFGETPIFPIQIFKVKEGVNYNPGDPNYDLYQKAIKVSAKRLFPNFSFIDSPFNLEFYKEGKPETEIAYMGAVTGDDIVYFKIHEKGEVFDYITSFRKAWEILSEKYGSQELDISEYVDLTPYDVRVRDSALGDYVPAKKIIKNPNFHNWYKVRFDNGKSLTMTEDHPLPVLSKGRTMVKDFQIWDKVPYVDIYRERDTKLKYVSITSIEKVEHDGHGYDFETISDRFDVSQFNSHNCRTRVIGNIYDPSREIVTGRGNLSFTSINLPRLAIEAKGDVDKFYSSLEDMVELVIQQLLERFRYQCTKKVYNYPFMMGNGVWLDSDKLETNDSVAEVLKHGTLTVGFIGLAEALKCLIGVHHGESEEAQNLGLNIIGLMRKRTDEACNDYKLNFSLIGTPKTVGTYGY